VSRHRPPLPDDAVPDREPWERQDGESDTAWEAWLVYRDSPLGERSIRKVAARMGRGTQGIAQFSKAWGWPTRAARYDVYLDRQRVAVRVDEVREMAKRHAQISALGVAALATPIQALAQPRLVDSPDNPNEPIEVPRLDDLRRMPTARLLSAVEGAARALTLLVGVERAARGAVTEHDLPPLTAEPADQEEPSDERTLDSMGDLLAALEDAGVVPTAVEVEGAE